MKIHKVNANNIKGTDFSLTFDEGNVIMGDNGSGKTSIIDALKLSILGEHDELGKQGKSISRLCDDGGLKASVIYDNGESSSFELTRTRTSYKPNHTGILGDDALRMILFPEEFWQAGSTTRTDLMIRMCGDSDLANSDLISSQLRRIRINGMTQSDRDDINNFANQAKETIEDGNISSIQRFEDLVKEERTVRNRKRSDLRRALEEINIDDSTSSADECKRKQREIEEALVKLNSEMNDVRNALTEQNSLESLLSQQNDSPTDDLESIKKQIHTLRPKLRRAKKLVETLSECLEDNIGFVSFSEETPQPNADIWVKGKMKWDVHRIALIPSDDAKWSSTDPDNADSVDDYNIANEKLEEIQSKMNKLKATRDAIKANNDSSNIVTGSTEAMNRLEELKSKNYNDKHAELDLRISALEDELTEAKKNVLTSVRSESLSEARDDLEIKCSEAERSYDNVKEVIKLIRSVQASIIDTAINGVLDTANKIAQDILPLKLCWNEDTLGSFIGDQFVSIDTFSGAERAVAKMGLGVALASKSNIKIALLDEVSRLDDKNTALLLRNMIQAIDDGIINQFVTVCISAQLERCIEEGLPSGLISQDACDRLSIHHMGELEDQMISEIISNES